ncbi:dethiobiotin synthase [Salinisphaera aquimarina]|uniref:ATP-dependent dethiobiotin synthetase BioD n=1 Tax=Salinisphaera aquimarina TaxID=2094031 RepID=A0ABV7ELV7_9GAMM
MTATTLFVTGTDTGVGKTRISVALLQGLRAAGHRAVGYKPIASGCERSGDGLRNDDALALQAASTPGWGYDAINPYAFAPPIAPHIAAADAGVVVDPAVLDAGHAQLAANSDWVIVEGAGGWHVPLSSTLDFADWVSAARWPVLLVVGMRLGCVNHAILSARAIAAGTTLAGWIANTLPPLQPRIEANIECLEQRIAAPLRARVPIDPPAELGLNPEPWIVRR